jgi:hypothetical protein
VQLFPDQFWFETSLGLATVVLLLAVGAAYVGQRLGSDFGPDGRRDAGAQVAG